IVLSQADFASKRWVKNITGTTPRAPSAPTTSGPSAAGKAVFAANGCGACHTLTAAAATGKVGPDLDKLPAEAKRAGQTLAAFIRESIVNPNAYVEPGFPKGVMPQNFGKVISKPALDTLVHYLVQSS